MNIQELIVLIIKKPSVTDELFEKLSDTAHSIDQDYGLPTADPANSALLREDLLSWMVDVEEKQQPGRIYTDVKDTFKTFIAKQMLEEFKR